jgi:hypothetical protein
MWSVQASESFQACAKAWEDVLHPDWTKLRILRSGYRITRLKMGIGKNISDTVDRRASAFVLIKLLQRGFRRLLNNPAADNAINFVNVSDTSTIIFKTRIIDEVWLSNCSENTRSIAGAFAESANQRSSLVL